MRHIKYLVLVLLAACGGNEGEVSSTELTSSAEGGEYAALGPDGTPTLPLNTQLDVAANTHLREAPSTDARVVMILPQGATVTVVERNLPENGYYRVEYFGRTGWAYGGLMALSIGTASSALTETQKDNILERARRSTGYSYWWGHGRFGCSLAKGNCSGGSHSGSAGADCSGMVAKAWAVPASAPGTCVDGHPYSSTTFATTEIHWNNILRANIERADAFVTRGGGHIMIRAAGSSSTGLPDIIECANCDKGCVHHYRSVSSDEYKVIRRHKEL